ncbi:hypothetical protein ACJIZ3_021400 [Penstemon smallii]|uniref:Growth-regulating factor n=1 Tax=Penstemon smallii TaxID=265156 RepID=A0ABD3SLY0_9LAMI
MMSNSGRNRYPFTASQWQELEHQALVFKYMISGMSVPPDLLFTIRRSLDSSLSSKYLIHQPQHSTVSTFHKYFHTFITLLFQIIIIFVLIKWEFFFFFFFFFYPEPGRCRRTDGKKWRCSKEAYTDSKYCERHMHRGRNRSRKPVEILSAKAGAGATTSPPTNAIPITTTTTTTTSVTKSTHLSSSHSSPTPNSISYESQFLYPHFSNSTRPQENTTNFFLESNAYSHAPGKDYRYD